MPTRFSDLPTALLTDFETLVQTSNIRSTQWGFLEQAKKQKLVLTQQILKLIYPYTGGAIEVFNALYYNNITSFSICNNMHEINNNWNT